MMTCMRDINLLPWRETLRRHRQRRCLIVFCLGLFLMSSVLCLMDNYVQNSIEKEAFFNKKLQNAIKSLDFKIEGIKRLQSENNRLKAQINTVMALSLKRTAILHLMEELIKIMPEGMYLFEIKRLGEEISIAGYAQSHTDITRLLHNMQHNIWLSHPILVDIKKHTDSFNNPEIEAVRTASGNIHSTNDMALDMGHDALDESFTISFHLNFKLNTDVVV